MADEITWTRLHAGVWSGVQRGRVVATVTRIRQDAYIGQRTNGTKVRASTAELARELLSETAR